jgi:hypothetical protein
MKFITVVTLLATAVAALPQAPAGAPAASATTPTVTTPKALGPIPSGIFPFSFADLGKLASSLGIDPAKATPDPSGYVIEV